MTAKEWLETMKQAADYNPAMTNLIEKYGEMLLAEQDNSGTKWIKTTDQLPERDSTVAYSQVPCLVIRRKKVQILVFNHEHECWDDESGDDYKCDIYWGLCIKHTKLIN